MQTGASPVQAASISVSSCIHPSCPAVFRKLCFYGGLHPSGSYDLLQVSLKGRPHDLQQIPTQNELSGICGASFSIACSDIFFFKSYRSLAYVLSFMFLCFDRTPMCRNRFVSVSICVACVSYLAPFSLIFFVLFLFAYFSFILFYYYLDSCLFSNYSNEGQKGCGSGWEERWGVSLRS